MIKGIRKPNFNVVAHVEVYQPSRWKKKSIKLFNASTPDCIRRTFVRLKMFYFCFSLVSDKITYNAHNTKIVQSDHVTCIDDNKQNSKFTHVFYYYLELEALYGNVFVWRIREGLGSIVREVLYRFSFDIFPVLYRCSIFKISFLYMRFYFFIIKSTKISTWGQSDGNRSPCGFVWTSTLS